MNAKIDADLLVIGGGSGGVRAARMAASRGAKVVLTEGLGHAGLGGTCVNVGCIPKKLYSYAAHYGEALHEASGYGWQVGPSHLDWSRLKAARAHEIARLNDVYAKLLMDSGVQVLHGFARFVDAHTVSVALADGQQALVRARHVLIATGGKPQALQVVGGEWALTSNDMFDLPTLPKHLLVVGAGYIACEFASIMNGLGVAVTQLVRGDTILRGFDDDVRSFLANQMQQAGVVQRFKTEVVRIDQTSDGELRITLNTGDTLNANAVLAATGRVPNTQGLGLEVAGVQVAPSGLVKVSDHLDADKEHPLASHHEQGVSRCSAKGHAFQTSVPHIYAVGDVATAVQLTPVALAQAMVVVDQLYGPANDQAPKQFDMDNLPSAVFTHPNVGTVGLTEQAARERFGHIQVFKSEFKPLVHTLSGSPARCLMKLIVDAASDRVVGLHMVGPDAGEVIQGFAVAMRAGATKTVFDATIGIHPTLAEEFVTMRTAVA